jgi:hypothetical protein
LIREDRAAALAPSANDEAQGDGQFDQIGHHAGDAGVGVHLTDGAAEASVVAGIDHPRTSTITWAAASPASTRNSGS